MNARIETILEKVEPQSTPEGLDLIRRAYLYAARAHAGQIRMDGQPYLTHTLETSAILADLRMDPKTIAIGLLHDTIEDTKTTLGDLEQRFGRDVAHVVDGVTKIGRIEFHSDEERQAENFRKLLMAMVDDPRVIMVKLADRLHNMRTLDFLPRVEDRHRISLETMEIYAPIARRLGIGKIWGELEDLAFRHLWPDEYDDLVKKIESMRQVSGEWTAAIEAKISEGLKEHGIEAEIHGRVKRLYSIHQKLRKQDISVNEVYDYIAFRVLTDSIKDCYAALGVVHNLWRPVPGRIKDFIAIAKANLYQSLHTTVMGDQGHPFEIQIRTHEMHRLAEEGVASHWVYKEGNAPKAEDMKGFAWLRKFIDYHRESRDPKEFLNWVKLDLFPDEVYTFTPRGEVRAFPREATPIDFAYAIHTEIGHQCVGAKINGKLVSLRTPLRNGDRVEILTMQDHKPSRDWLKYVKTAKARQKIVQWLNLEQKRRNLDLGRRLLDREIKKHRKTPKDIDEALASKALQELGLARMDDLYTAVGYGRVSAKHFLEKSLKGGLPEPPVAGGVEEARPAKTGKETATAVKVKSFDDMMVTRARCCNPVWGEEIFGYVTRGRGVSVHTKNCPNAFHLLLDPERSIDVEWEPLGERTYDVKLSVFLMNVPGLLAKLSAQIAALNTNIVHIGSRNASTDRGYIDFVVQVRDIAHLKDLIRNLSQVKGVLEVQRE